MVNKFLDNDKALCIKISFRRLTGSNIKVFEALLFEHHHIPRGGRGEKSIKKPGIKISKPGFIFDPIRRSLLKGGYG